nr:MAG TPA: hypothetical protein [Caudoviricetes sp.]
MYHVSTTAVFSTVNAPFDVVSVPPNVRKLQ